MNSDAIRELLHRQPFEPFEVRMSDGGVHRVNHPEFALLSPSRLVILDPVADRLSILALLHVVELRTAQPA